MKIVITKATSKASLIRALRANSKKFKSIKTLKRAGKTKVGTYKVHLKK